MYAKAADAANLKTRFKERLKRRNIETKEMGHGTRWLKPDRDDLLVRGEVKAPKGPRTTSFLTLTGELLPRDSWSELPANISGVYVLFDSSETARYVGISNDVRTRLGKYFAGHLQADDDKRTVAVSFSVFMVSNRKHARELESLLIHVLGPALFLNKRKQRRYGIRPDVKVFEAGTLLLQRRDARPPSTAAASAGQ